MKRQILIFFLTLFALQTNAQKIHWLLFIDTKDSEVGQLDINGREYLKANFIDVINAGLNSGGIQSKIYDYYGDRLTPVNCSTAVKNFQCSNKDIVVFYYIGHGGRSVRTNPNEHPWPKMWLGQDDPNQMIDLEWVHDQLKSKSPRLLFTIGMCCNVKQNLPSGKNPTFGAQYSPKSEELSEQQLAHIKDVFLNTCGDLLATSASPGQSSGGGEFVPPLTKKPMDYYTAGLVAIFNNMVEDQEIDFVTLFRETGEFINNATNQKQTPYFEEHLRKGECGGGIVPPPPPPPPTMDCSGLSDMSKMEHLFESAMLSRTNIPNQNKLFATNCSVITLAQDGTTTVGVEPIDNFLLRITTSKVLLKVVPVKSNVSGCKITELYVREFYKTKEPRRR